MNDGQTRPLRMLVAGRLVVGGGTLLAPRLAGRVFGIRTETNPALPYVARLFGARAVLMALLAATSHGAERRRQLRAGLGVDLTDAAAAILAGRRGELTPLAAALATGAALTETALGVLSLAAVERGGDRDAGAGGDQQDRPGG